MHVHWLPFRRILPGGLNVRRRAFDMHQNLIGLAIMIRLKAGFEETVKPK
jgi:hypothetical protein